MKRYFGWYTLFVILFVLGTLLSSGCAVTGTAGLAVQKLPGQSQPVYGGQAQLHFVPGR